MTDEQIIKNLKEITDNKIIRNTTCIISLSFLGEILDLIDRQKAKIEKLQKENERWKNGFMGSCMLENCKLKDEWKSEAIKEFAERLKKYLCFDLREGISVVTIDNIDNLVKEMTEVQQ